MRFTKMHGIGNDYVYVNCFAEPTPADPATLSIKISDRHFGVGSDGLILITPSASADARMRMFNNDGSESEMCGNGLRCVAKYVYDHAIAQKPQLRLETGRGILAVDLEIDATSNTARRVTIDMGTPILEAAKIPTTLPGGRIVNHPHFSDSTSPAPSWWAEAGLDPRITLVSMGNPHLVAYCKDVSKVPLEVVGPAWENASIFPRRINVHFVQVHTPDEVTMRTWERGSGVTLACGTGACAVAVAGVLTGRSSRRIVAHLPGGDLELAWPSDDAGVRMTGPATEVFTGIWPD